MLKPAQRSRTKVSSLGTLRNSRQTKMHGKIFGNFRIPGEPPQSCRGQDNRVELPLTEFPQACIQIAAQHLDGEIRAVMQQLGLPAQTAGADSGTGLQLVQPTTVARNQHPADLLAAARTECPTPPAEPSARLSCCARPGRSLCSTARLRFPLQTVLCRRFLPAERRDLIARCLDALQRDGQARREFLETGLHPLALMHGQLAAAYQG